MASNAFRETAWFKLGVTEDEARAADAEHVVVALPLEDRYGSHGLTAHDSRAFGLHTGTTGRIETARRVVELPELVPMAKLVRELKVKNRMIAMTIGALVVAIALVVALAV